MARRRPDRAQTLRTRRQWWSRHGAFARGMAVGAALAMIVIWGLHAIRVV